MRRVVPLLVVPLLAACPSRPEPAAPAPAPLATNAAGAAWIDEAAARCARIASCAHAHDTPRLRDPGACIDWWIAHVKSETDPVHGCLVGAKTCDAIGACLRDHGDARAAAYCASHKGVMTGCDGANFVSCADDDAAESTLTDCAALGGTCEERAQGGLVVRGCFSPKLCPARSPEERCEGNAVVSCHDGAVEKSACGPGTRCDAHREANGDTAAMCEPISGHAHCAQLGARYCHGELLVECLVHGHFGDVRVSDCPGLGLTCAGTGARAACVVKKPLECEPAPARCDGEDLAFCAAGRSVKVGCKRLGLGACDPAAQGPAAACSRPK